MSLAFAEVVLLTTGFIAGAAFVLIAAINGGVFGLLVAAALASLVTTYVAAFGRHGDVVLATGCFGGSAVAAVIAVLVLMTWG